MLIFFDLMLLLVSLYFVTKSAEYAVLHSSKVASGLKVPRHVVGFLLVAFISALPEFFISIDSAFNGSPALGLGTLFGSNVADLSLIFGLVVILSSKSLKVESKFIKNSLYYLLLLILPIILGLNGSYSRIEGLALILAGVFFYALLLKHEKILEPGMAAQRKILWKHLFFLIISIIVLIVAADYTSKFGISLAGRLYINPTLIGLFIIALGTTLPELFFSVQAINSNDSGLAIGDILGNVLTDATIIIGLIAIISPFSFNPRIIYVTGIFMIIAGIFLFYLIRTGKNLSLKEAWLLIIYYFIFILSEITISRYFD